MSGIFTKIGSFISGIRESISGIGNAGLETQPEPQYIINENGEIEDIAVDVEMQSENINPAIGNHAGSILKSRIGFSDVLKAFKKPIDIIQQKIPAKKGKAKIPVSMPAPETPAESSRQQKRTNERSQKKAEKKPKSATNNLDIEFKEIELNEWHKKRRIISIYRGLVPKGNPVEGDELLLLESIREKIKNVLRTEQEQKKRIRFTIYLNATMAKSIHVERHNEAGEYTHTEVVEEPEDHQFQSTMDYILNEFDINDDLISNSYEQIFNQIDKYIRQGSGWKFKRGINIDIKVHQYKITRGGSKVVGETSLVIAETVAKLY